MASALEGIRVLDFSQMMFGPWCTQLLADMGAEVIKVERTDGEWERGLHSAGELAGDSPFFLAMNRNKKSLAVDLKHPEVRYLILKLVENADLVVENFRPGVMDRLGFGWEQLHEIRHSLVYLAGSGYGPSGPYVDKPGQDLLLQALSGLAAATGRSTDPPTPMGCSVIDAAGSLTMAFAAVTGLIHAMRTGEGQRIDVSLLNTAVALQCQEISALLNLDQRWTRSSSGVAAPWHSAPYGIYATADGHLALAMNSLTTLGEALNLPLAVEDTPQDAYQHRDRIKTLIEARLRESPTADWLRVLGGRGIWCAPVQDLRQVVDDPQVRHNHLIRTIKHKKAGQLRIVGPTIAFSATPSDICAAPPLVGEHTEEVLRGIGVDQEALMHLIKEGAVACAE